LKEYNTSIIKVNFPSKENSIVGGLYMWQIDDIDVSGKNNYWSKEEWAKKEGGGKSNDDDDTGIYGD